MNKAIWAGVLFLSLGGWGPGLVAQQFAQHKDTTSYLPAPGVTQSLPETPLPGSMPGGLTQVPYPAMTEGSSSPGEGIPGSLIAGEEPPAGDAGHPGIHWDNWVDPWHPTFYAKVEPLLWWAKKDQVPVLVTTGPTPVGLPSASGVLGAPGTQVLFGGGELDHGFRGGVRATAGWWLDLTDDDSYELTGLYLPHRSVLFQATSPPQTVIARPFFDATFGVPTAQLIAFPGISTGFVTVRALSELWGLEVKYKCSLLCGSAGGGDYRIWGFVGPRYLNFAESITVLESIQPVAGSPLPFQLLAGIDRFQAVNQFMGGEVGLEAAFQGGRWGATAKFQVGVGAELAALKILGAQGLFPAVGQSLVFQGDLLALPSNIGVFHHDHFAVVPETNLDVGYLLAPCLRCFVGYNCLYDSSVVRPGQQIDTTLNSTQIPNFLPPGTPVPPGAGQNRPAVTFHETTYWVQGVTVGLEFRY